MPQQKVLILGASGMLGSTLYRFFASSPGFSVLGTVRSAACVAMLPRSSRARIEDGVDVSNSDRIARCIGEFRPDVLINSVGVIKQLDDSKDPLTAIEINSLFPHRVAALCQLARARMIHISTDCVFDGRRGNYLESDTADATDLYGRSKYLGELGGPNNVTLRTSIIGHEMGRAISLVDWFLAQPGPTVRGYRRAIFSGLPTVELARVVRDFVIPNQELHGLWHVASEPINKCELLNLIARAYNKTVDVLPSDDVIIDRSLNASRFRKATGYVAPPWSELVKTMHDFR